MPYVSPRSSGSTGYRSPRLRSPRKRRKEKPSLGGFLGNLAENARDAVYGLPRGLYEVGSSAGRDVYDIARDKPYGLVSPAYVYSRLARGHTGEIAEGVGRQYAHMYGPLARGDVGEFGHRLYEDPLGPILDALTVASLGTGAAAKAGLTPGTALALKTPAGAAVSKSLSRSTLRAWGQRGEDALLRRLFDPETSVVGEFSRAARVERKQLRADALADQAKLTPFDQSLRKLRSSSDRAALWALLRIPVPRLYEVVVSEKAGTPLGKALANPKTRAAYEKALAGSDDFKTRRLLAARSEAQKIADEQAALLGLPDDVVERSRFRTLLLALGRKPAPPRTLDTTPVYFRNYLVGKRVRALDRDNLGTIEAVDAKRGTARVHFYNKQTRAKETVTLNLDQLSLSGAKTRPIGSEFEIGSDPDIIALKAEIPEGFEPVYLPDLAEIPGRSAIGFGRGGGKGVQRATPEQSVNRGVLFATGQLIADPAVLSKSYLRSARAAHYMDVHDTLVQNAIEVPLTEARTLDLRGYEFVRRPVVPIERQGRVVVGGTPERIPYSVRSIPELERELEARFGSLEQFSIEHSPRDIPLTTRSLEEAVTGSEGRTVLVVPRSYARTLAGEFKRSSRFAYLLNRGPMRVWRALVLNLRPAWLVNNVLGNSLLYLVAEGDAKGLRALVESFRRTWPKHADEFEDLFRRHFPEQASGTFIGTQRPTLGGRTGRALGSKVVAGLADVDRWYETVLRRAAVKAELRKHPELRKRVEAMREETPDFMQAARRVLDEDPTIARAVSERVNTALGDFIGLSSFERDYIRTVFPFYAWYRAITLVTLKLPLEHPLKANLLADLGDIGAEMNLEGLGVQRDETPPFLRSAIPLGEETGGRVPALVTSGVNPYATTVDVGEFLTALSTGKPGSAGREFPGVNPLLGGIAEQIFGQSLTRGTPLPDRRGGVVANMLRLTGEGLPQYRLGTALARRNYRGTPSQPTLYDRDALAELLRYLGIPRAEVSLRRARAVEESRR